MMACGRGVDELDEEVAHQLHRLQDMDLGMASEYIQNGQ